MDTAKIDPDSIRPFRPLDAVERLLQMDAGGYTNQQKADALVASMRNTPINLLALAVLALDGLSGCLIGGREEALRTIGDALMHYNERREERRARKAANANTAEI